MYIAYKSAIPKKMIPKYLHTTRQLTTYSP